MFNHTLLPNLFGDYALGKTTYQAGTKTIWRKVLALPSYHWVLLSVAMVLLVHAWYIPLWLSLAGLVSLLAQLPMFKQKQSTKLKRRYQGVQMLGFILGLGGIWLSYGQLLGAEVSICFLLLCLVAKLWEMYDKRDGYVTLNLCLFVLASAFLWSQEFGVTLMVFVALLAVLLGFIALADDSNDTGAGRVRALALLTIPSVPLLVVLFLFFPRLPPLWSLQMSAKQATTGVSDSMSPGDFANLSKSTDLAFRVEFSEQIPSINQMYWRGLIFSEFDGITWRPSSQSQDFWWSVEPQMPSWASVLQGKNQGDYRVLIEPTQQNWLFGLDYSRLQPQRGLGTNEDFTLRSFRPITQAMQYRADYYPNVKVGLTLSDDEIEQNTRLPKGNDKSRKLAQELYQQAGGDTRQLVGLIHQYIVDNQFSYTLSPPLLGGERIDEFLFNSRAGFCEHYASSFVFLMRSVGVPAQVVAGYQGGQLGRDGVSWEVRQMDAHAWAQVWIPNEGWVRVDPTGFVSPDRIESGMTEFTQNAGASVFGDGIAGTIGYQQFRLLQQLNRYSDQLSYYWQKQIVDFDSENQKNSLWRWFNITSLTEQLMVLLATSVLIVSLLGGYFWYRRRVIYHVFDKPIVKLSKKLGKYQRELARLDSEGYLNYLQRLAMINDKATDDIAKLKATYREYRYGKHSQLENDDNKAYLAQARQFAQAVKKLENWFKS